MRHNIIVLSGASAAGKSTLARQLQRVTQYPVVSIREHYTDRIVPEFLQATGRDINSPMTRALHMEAADWMYAQDPAGHAKRLLQDILYKDGVIIESLRIKGDIAYLHDQFLDELHPIFVDANEQVRLERKLHASDALYSTDTTEIEASLQYEWDHFHLAHTKAYIASIGGTILENFNRESSEAALHTWAKKFITEYGIPRYRNEHIISKK